MREKKPARRSGPAPVAELTPEFIRACGQIQMTQEEIGRLFGVRQPSICARLKRDKALREAWEQGKEEGRMSLRRAQFKNAVEKNSTVMQIWLGKNYLDQKDAPHTLDQNVSVEVRYLAEWGGGGLAAAEAPLELEGEVTEEEDEP